MGLRFRKSVKFGPFRASLSKSGISYSAGVKGMRITRKAGGGYRTTASIPGTGISYSKDLPEGAAGGSGTPPTPPEQPAPSGADPGGRDPRKYGFWDTHGPAVVKWVVIVLVCAGLFKACTSMDAPNSSGSDQSRQAAISSQTDADTSGAASSAAEDPDAASSAPEASPGGSSAAESSDPAAAAVVVPAPAPVPAASAQPPETPAPAPAASTPAADPAPQERTVYVTKSGKRYHYNAHCGNGNYYESTLSEAKARGLTPCQKCA